MARGPDCPTLEDLGEYEAGLKPSDQAVSILDHVADCPACAALLADVKKSENAATDPGTGIVLRSSTAAWKRSMLTRIATEMTARPERSPERSGGQAWNTNRWWVAVAASILAVIGTLWWTSSRNTPEAAFALIAQAYSQQRPFELRIPGADHAPVVVERGALESPAVALLDAQRLIADRIKQAPDSAAWLRANARADLLQWRYSAAIEALRHAQETEPNNPGILGDLGIAYLQRAEMESRPQDISQAIEYLSMAVDAAPAEPAYRFNLALAYERQPAPRQALEEWNELLRVEPSGAWADEAREHIERLRRSIDRQAERAESPRTSEDAIMALAAAGFRSTPPLDARVVAADLAQVHGDVWMQDFLKVNLATDSRFAIESLEAAVKAFTAGESSQGEASARRAVTVFRAAGNVPGTVFAAFQHAYALQRLSRPRECVEAAREQTATAQARRYRWLEVQLRLTSAACMAAQGKYAAAYQSELEAHQLAQDAGYTTLDLRALGMRAETLRSAGSYSEALNLDAAGLRRFWGDEGSLTRGYQFYYDMAMAASGLQRPRAAASLMNEAVHLAAMLPDRYVEAMVRALFAGILVEDHKIDQAARQFDRSGEIFDSLPGSPSSSFYRSYAEISRARLEGQQKQVEKGLHRLDRMESMLDTIRNANVEAQLWSVKSELLTLAGRGPESDDVLRRILVLGASARAAAPGQGDPSMLAREVAGAVRILSDRHLQRDEAEQGWRIWMEYNPSFRSITASGNTARLIYADLPSGPVVWISDVSGVHAERLPVSSDALERLAENFRRALANPGESTQRIRDLGRQLHSQLIDPIHARLEGVKTLYIAADGFFAAIPFGALVSGDGRWLADRYRVAYSPPAAGGSKSAPPGLRTDLPLVAAGYGQAAQVLQTVLPSLPGMDEDLDAAAGALPKHTLLRDRDATVANLQEALANAGVFHFSGHAIVTAGDAALVLAPGGPAGQDRLLWASRIPKQAMRRCRLVMLAACSTGRAAGEDSDPSSIMARAFLMSGVPEVIAARWDVDSRATSALVKKFYGNVAQGASSEEALAASLLELRQQPAFAHPYYWAAFDLFRS